MDCDYCGERVPCDDRDHKPNYCDLDCEENHRIAQSKSVLPARTKSARSAGSSS